MGASTELNHLTRHLITMGSKEAGEGVGLGVEYDLVEGQYIIGAEEEVEVFECFSLRIMLAFRRIGLFQRVRYSPAKSSPCCHATGAARSVRRLRW